MSSELDNRIVEVVEEVSPSVVGVVTLKLARDLLLRPMPFRGLGSGFVVRREGLIATSNHVVEGVSKVGVLLYDGDFVEAEVAGRDPQRDLGFTADRSS